MTEKLEIAQNGVGYRFGNAELLSQALTHASLTEQRQHSNERLEFLGDAVLGLVCCEQIYEMFPLLLEGEMTKIKSMVVSRQTCAVIAREVGLDQALAMGKGMQVQRSVPQSLAAGALESIIAAMYLDGGLEPVRAFLRPRLEPLILKAEASGHQENFKSLLQQFAQQTLQATVSYLVMDEKGPDHAKAFEMCAQIGDRRFKPCWGQSKKQAEQLAAMTALAELGVLRAEENGEVRLVKPEAVAPAK